MATPEAAQALRALVSGVANTRPDDGHVNSRMSTFKTQSEALANLCSAYANLFAPMKPS